MKKLTKILGVGLTIAVLASLLVAVAPVSAGNESWTQSSALSKVTGKLAAGTDIIDIAVAADGLTGYVAVSDNTVWKTVDGGNNFTKTAYAGGTPSKMAVAPDSADYVAVASGSTLYISMSGGVVFGTTAPTAGFGGTINSVAVGPTAGTGRNVAVTTAAAVWVFAAIPGDIFGAYQWTDVTLPTASEPTPDVVGAPLAAKFSPSFGTDFTLVVVTTVNATASYINVYNTYFGKWNSDYALYGIASPGIPVTTAVAPTAAEIALPGTYYGFDPTVRTAYVAFDTAGLFRNGTRLSATGVSSVSLNTAGDKLVAGAAGSNTVYSISSPSAFIPGSIVPQSSAFKSPGGTSKVIARFFGTNVGAGTTGPESAFALSSTGTAFNDVAFIDTVPAVVDMAIKSDAGKTYLVTYYSGTTSLWRNDTAWVRVFRATGANWIVRPSLDNFDVVYLVQQATTNIFYSNDAGETTWQIRVGPSATIQDFAAETPSILYALTPGGAVAKATDSGIIWATSLTAVGAGGSINMISAGNLLIAGASGVSYTADSGATWTTPILTLSGAIAASADKLSSGGVIIAATATGIQKYTIGTSPAFSGLGQPTVAAPSAFNSLVRSGTLTYAMSNNATDSVMYRSPVSSMSWTSATSTAKLFCLKTAGANLYALNSEDNSIYIFTEVLAAKGPEQVTPVDKFLVQANVETGKADAVVFQWKPVPGTEALTTIKYNLRIYLDSAGTQMVYDITDLTAALNVIGPNTPIGSYTDGFDYQANTNYYWKVRVSSPFDSPWSSMRNFRIDALAPLKISAPASGASDVSVLPTFVWSPVRDATEYQIVVADRDNFDIITFSHNTDKPMYAVTEDEQLAYGTVYYWRVKASKPDGVASAWVTGIFTTEQKPTPTQEPITITQPAPTTITVEVPPPQEVIPAYLLWIIIGIGAILVIALIVLIVRTRRVS